MTDLIYYPKLIVFTLIFQTVYSSLKQMLEYTEPDLEDVFMQTFKVCHQDVFGTVLYHELKENADQINVTQENKQVSTVPMFE